MTTYYIDPSLPANGDGSYLNPFNSWGWVTFASGNIYLQKTDTTYHGKLTISVIDVLIGAYGDGSLPKINGAGYDRCVNIVTGGESVVLQYLELYGPNSGITRRCISFVGDNHVFEYLDIHDPIATTTDVDAIAGVGNGITIKNSIIYSIPSDGIWIQGKNTTIIDNDISNVATDGRLSGDCIQLYGDSTLGCGGSYIARNRIDHTSAACKQGILVQDISTGVGCIIEDNTITGPSSSNYTNVLIEIPGAIVRRNRISGGGYGVIAQSVSGRGHYCMVNSNIITGGLVAGICQKADTQGIKSVNNTVVECDFGILIESRDAPVVNNILYDCNVGIKMYSGLGEDYNCYFANDADKVSSVGSAFGINSIAADPKLTTDYKTKQNSPCKSAGLNTDVLDFNGHIYGTPPTIGATEVGRFVLLT